MNYVDSHVHLGDKRYLDDIERVLKEAFENMVNYILSVSEDYSSSLKNIALKDYGVYIGLGVHPWTAIYKEEDIEKTVKLIEDNIERIDAIGEVGLDKKYPDSVKYWDREVEVFKKMIYLSKEYNRTLNIHSRKAEEEVIKILYEEDVEKAYLHWFTGNQETLKNAIESGYYIGFTPSSLYSRRIQRMIYITPLENILTETDGPVSFYGPLKNELTRPIHVKLIVQKIAEIKEIEVKEVADRIVDNFVKLFIKK